MCLRTARPRPPAFHPPSLHASTHHQYTARPPSVPKLQGLTHARVTFTSEATGEFCFYELKLTSTSPAPRGTLSLECPVRTQTAARVQIANPLPTEVALKAVVAGSKQVGATGAPHARRPQSRNTSASASPAAAASISF